MAHHHHHSHAADISAAEQERIKAFGGGAPEEQILGELAFFSAQNRTKTGLWTMGELDRFVTEYLPSHVGDDALTKAAPEVIVRFARWLKDSGEVPTCDVAAVEKRMRKIRSR